MIRREETAGNQGRDQEGIRLEDDSQDPPVLSLARFRHDADAAIDQ
jgi:hypothetical protein